MESQDVLSRNKRKLSRSHTGCQKCRQTKVKCDEVRPHCGRCVRLRHECDFSPRPRKKYTRKLKQPETDARSQIESPTSAARSIVSHGSQAEGTSSSPTQLSSQGTGQAEDLDLSSLCHESLGILDPLDYAAIHYFRFVMPVSVDGKTPKYSGPAVIWALAEKDVMVMHATCAYAGRNFCEKLNPSLEEAYARKCVAVEHCAAALSMLNAALEGHREASDLNCILGALWMMISYEQGFGDGSGHGFRAHLSGAAAMYKGRIGNIRDVLTPMEPTAPSCSAVPSSLTCQLMIWIGIVDGGAAINGLGGAFCRLLGETKQQIGQMRPTAQLEIFGALQTRADMNGYELWGASYPQDEFVDDLQNSRLMTLQAEVGQLRYLLSYLIEDSLTDFSTGLSPGIDVREVFEKELHNAVRNMATRYDGIFRIASFLDTSKMASPSQKRFVVSARHICAFFHATVLCFLRLVRGNQSPDEEQRASLREIMALSSLAHQDNGEDGMVQFAWALFVAALESDDIIHRRWIMDRMGILAKRGENFRRAHNALRRAMAEQGMSDRRLDYARLVRREDIERFVLT